MTVRAVLLLSLVLVAAPAFGQLSQPTLTVREREVATLAGRGLSNRAIAERLVVSVHTVETHLARSYAKLGITRRAQLPEALAADRRAGTRPGPRAPAQPARRAATS